MAEELNATSARDPDSTVTVHVGDLDNMLMVAISALYEADARCDQIEAEKRTRLELEAK
jgi:hypothetical protein